MPQQQRYLAIDQQIDGRWLVTGYTQADSCPPQDTWPPGRRMRSLKLGERFEDFGMYWNPITDTFSYEERITHGQGA